MVKVGSLGGVSDEEISSAALSMVSPPTEAGASLDTRFVRKISDLVDLRLSKGEVPALTIFLRSDSLQKDRQACSCTEFPLLTNGQDPISGAVWLSTASISSAYKLELPVSKDYRIFESIRQAGLGHLPAVVIDWRSSPPLGALYREGLNQSDLNEQVSFEIRAVSQSEIKEALDRFYERAFRTPLLSGEGGGNKVWSDASKGIPMFRPESIIQGRLCDMFKSFLTRHEIRPETTTQDGRADIVIYRKALTQSNMPAIVNEWVLELKALCDMTSLGQPVAATKIPEAISGGLEQAIAYKSTLNAINAALCCFDMLKSDTKDTHFKHVAQPAKDVSVHLWRWYLFRSTSESRSAKHYVPQAVK